MATTITPSDLIVTITEAYTLNGVAYGNNITRTITDSGEVSQRVMNIGTVDTSVLYYSIVDSAGTVVANDFRYFRITNLDDTNFVTLEIYNGTDTAWFKLGAGESMLFMNNEFDADSSRVFGALADISQIEAKADTAACDIEFVSVTK